jgi:hypothetical protein
VRERACGRLVALGPLVVPLLRHTLREGSNKVAASEAEKCLSQLGREGPGPLPSAAARLLALRKPAGSAEVLLRYLPFADTDDMAEELRTTLTAVARHDGKVEPALEKALTDKVATRRAVAAEVLASVATAAELNAVKPLLKDPEPTVRLRAALSLASAQDREAVPTLIALLTELPNDQAWPAEECLLQLAGDKGPDAPQGAEPAERAKKRKAWEAWWKKNGAKVDLLVLKGRTNHEPFHNYTLLVGNNNNMISELDAEGKERWQITGVINPMDAHVLPGNRVLVAEFGGNRVSERNLKGEVLWDKAIAWPISAERLPNGNTLIVARNEILEVSREKKEVFAYRRNMNDIMAGRRLRSGELIVVTSGGQCLRMDSKGKQVGMFPINVGSMGIDVLPNGHVLSPGAWGSNRVQEFDIKGKVVWEAAAPQQTMSATRAPNGNTVVTTQMWPPKVAEIDKKGKVVWEHPLTTYAMRARKR